MLEGLLNTVKGLFVKPDGGINWRTIIGIGAGAALGGLGIVPFFGSDPMTAAFLGGGVGLVGSALVGMIMPDSPAAGAGAPGAPGPVISPPAPGVQLSPTPTPVGMGGPQAGGRSQ